MIFGLHADYLTDPARRQDVSSEIEDLKEDVSSLRDEMRDSFADIKVTVSASGYVVQYPIEPIEEE